MKREEAKEQLWNILFNNFRSEEKDKEALEMAIKALEQESILDKIRAEIEQLPITDTAIKLVSEILEKYKTESEDKYGKDSN